jgi:hypothetical protein
MFTFYGVVFLTGPQSAFVERMGHAWSTVLLISASAALYATLSAPRRRDPDQSLIIELWACISLCILMAWLEIVVLGYRTESGDFPVTAFGLGLIFFVAFGARAIQIIHDRKALKKFRSGTPPGTR